MKSFLRTAGLAVVALLIGGSGLVAHAQTCDNANCMLEAQRAVDPAYQAAIHSSWPYVYTASYGYGYPYYSYPYASYPSYGYANYDYGQYSYGQNYQQPRNSYWMNGCLITTVQTNGVIRTTRACGY